MKLKTYQIKIIRKFNRLNKIRKIFGIQDKFRIFVYVNVVTIQTQQSQKKIKKDLVEFKNFLIFVERKLLITTNKKRKNYGFII